MRHCGDHALTRTPDLPNWERSKLGKIDCHSNQSYSRYLCGVSKLEASCDVIPHIQERQHSPLIQQALLMIEIELTQATETLEASQVRSLWEALLLARPSFENTASRVI
jgi:hypothetical protein